MFSEQMIAGQMFANEISAKNRRIPGFL